MHLFKENSKWVRQDKLCNAFSADFDPSVPALAISLQFDNTDMARPLTRTRLAVSDYISSMLTKFDRLKLGDEAVKKGKRTSTMTSIDQMESAACWSANIILQMPGPDKSHLENVIACVMMSFTDFGVMNGIELRKLDVESLIWNKAVLTIAGINPSTIDGSNTFLTKYK